MFQTLKMSYTDFYIRLEHKFSRNIYSEEELASPTRLSTLEKYYKIFDKSLTVTILLKSTLNNNLTLMKLSTID